MKTNTEFKLNQKGNKHPFEEIRQPENKYHPLSNVFFWVFMMAILWVCVFAIFY